MRSHILLLFIIGLLFSALVAKAQFLPVDGCPTWQWLNPYPYGAESTKIFSTTQGLIAYTYASFGVFSRNGGKTWQEFTPKDTAGKPIVVCFPGYSNQMQFVNDSVGFFVDTNTAIYESTDGGNVWFPNGGRSYANTLQMVTEIF
ncbi:MAG TPA: hypothetical protein VFJ29_04070, partial [Candidatus Kapabacteria bacterium]|nr:hypothetical protein [Candidatus Kapabacteria bacterium]